MPRRKATPAKRTYWERGYFSHGYWLGKKKLGTVRLGRRGEWDGIYRWEAGTQKGEAATLEQAKRAVEAAALLGVQQLGLFDQR